ncbi:MAG: hypothetical protein JWM57_2378, partial [Phycisphaerales bacterium]|nr:hypothetical protein [Phycisphaerales bacterium]
MNIHDAANGSIVVDANATQSDGKMILAGHLYKTSNTAVIARYNVDGTIDKTFGTNGYATVANAKGYAIDKVVVLSNGKVEVGGQMFLRLTSAGKLDTSFSGDGIAPSYYAGDKRQGDAILS